MTIKSRPLIVIVLSLTLSLAGLAVALPMQQDGPMSHSSAACAAHCLGASHAPSTAPIVTAVMLPLMVAAFVGLVVYMLHTAEETRIALPALARPSPNYISLYSHRLD